MPFTPFHFGPGLLCKSLAPRRVSFTSFCATQVAMDLEPLYFILHGEAAHAHRAVHTVLGGGVVGLAVGLAVWRLARSRSENLGPVACIEVARGPAVLGGLIGGTSHALLDGLMHLDMRPLRPFSEVQWVLRPPMVIYLYAGCLVAGVLGLIILMVRREPWSHAGTASVQASRSRGSDRGGSNDRHS